MRNSRHVAHRGYASHDFAAHHLFVPEKRHYVSHSLDSLPGPLYHTSLFHLWAPNIAGVALGTAQDAIDTFIGLAQKKRPVLSREPLAQRETVQEKLGRAQSLVRSSRSFLLDTIHETWAFLSDDREVPEELTARNRLAASTAVDISVAAVDSLFTLAGTLLA
jgi:3-hydroxy-9,10-secoandrosta-1,3,5(10)-triene-9,17-dione monooxygenase